MLNDLSPEDKRVVDTLTRSIVNKILHDPTDSIEERRNEVQIRAARELFHL